jgi:HAE1 family hydrophobic/amphiphilic exporter-1
VIRLAIERPVSTIVAAVTLAALGLFALLQLPVSLLPSMERPSLVVTVTRDGASREELLREVTEPLEQRLAATRGARSIRSETEDGRARVTIESAWQTDIDRLRIDVARRMDGAIGIPVDETSVAIVGDPLPIIEVAVAGGESSSARSNWAREILVPELARAHGAGRVEILGTSRRHMVVRPDHAALAARGLTADAVRQRLSEIGEPLSAGQIREGAVTRPVLIRETIDDIDALNAVLVPSPGGGTPLRDLVSVSIEEVSDGTMVRLDGRSATLVRVYRAPGENAVLLGRDVLERVATIRSSGIDLDLVIARDRTVEIVKALSDLGLAALTGVLLATLLLRFMTGNWRPTLALAVVIPTSILIAFGAFRAAGISLDIVSLAGLALAAGMIVDNSIVVLESIETMRSKRIGEPELAGTRAVAVAVTVSTLTTMLVFVPLVYLQGVARAFFGAQAFAIVAAIGASLLLSFTLTPVLAGRGRFVSGGRSPGRGRYLELLDRLLARPGVFVASALLFMLGAAALAVALPRELVPESVSREVVVDFELAPGTVLEEASAIIDDLEEAIRSALPESARLTTAVVYGLAEDGTAPVKASEAGTRGRVNLLFPSGQASAEAIGALRDGIADLAGMRASVVFARSAFLEGLGSSTGGAEVAILADGEESLVAAEKAIRSAIEAAGYAVLDKERALERTIYLDWDRTVLSRLDSGRSSLERQVEAALTPGAAGATRLPGVESAIRFDGDPSLELESLPVVVTTKSGAAGETRTETVPLGALARFSSAARGSRIERLDGRIVRRLTVPASLGDVSGIRDAVSSAALTGTQEVRPMGEMLEMGESFRQLRLLLLLSIVLVYLAVAAFYESFVRPLIVMLAVPAAAAGAFVLLAVGGQTLNVMSVIGIVLLGGIVVNQSILVVDRAAAAQAEGASAETAVRIAAEERYRPIVMTALTTMIGMVPLMLLGGDGEEIRRALATAVVGGLVTATITALLFVPLAYVAVERLRRRVDR